MGGVQNVPRGIGYNFFLCFNLIFWDMIGCSIAHFGWVYVYTFFVQLLKSSESENVTLLLEFKN